MLRRNYRCLFLYGLNMGTGTRINLVNNYVSRGTFLFVMLHRREIVCCLPSYPTRKASGTDICLSVCFTLDCVQFSQTDCASVRFNLDNGNKTSP